MIFITEQYQVTGSVDSDGRITIYSPLWHKVIAGVMVALLTALILTGASALYEYGKIKDDIPITKKLAGENKDQITDLQAAIVLIKRDVDENTSFRAEGPRVTSKDLTDLERLVADGGKERAEVFKGFVQAQSETNKLLSGMATSLGKIEVKVETIQKEQDRARDEIDSLKGGQP